ncbi:MAG: hypothetical protein JRJ87_27965 [Deltaproteobacteria bacterium]|nr:hypothetical protein [Deltaproteobacteria bacterium]
MTNAKCTPIDCHDITCGTKCCGDDGCGTGTDCNYECAADWACNRTNCNCEPCASQCDDLECGLDPVCGEFCGTCAQKYLCKDNQCVLAGFSARVQQFGGEALIYNVEIRALDNTSGAELGINAVSGTNGWVAFEELPDGPVGFRAVGVPDAFVDTYQYHFASASVGERIWIVDETNFVGAPLMAGVNQLAGNALIFGRLSWLSATGDDEDVGCATIEVTPDNGEVRYMRDSTNPMVSYFMIANVAPGLTTVTAFPVSTEVRNTQVMCFADSVCMADIVLRGPGNPTPDGCE